MVDVTIRKWGNSLGVVLPKDFIEEHNLKEADRIRVEITRLKARDLFGMYKGKLGDPQEIKDLARDGWDD